MKKLLRWMKFKSLWVTALVALVLCGFMWWQLQQNAQQPTQIGVGHKTLVLSIAGSPNFSWGGVPNDSGLRHLSSSTVELESLMKENKAVYANTSAALVQPGFYLLEPGTARVFVLTSDFGAFDATSQVSLKSDWIILERSSLLPQNWPEPRYGWAVLNNGTLSKSLKTKSLETQKPIVRPHAKGSVWLQKSADETWEVHLPL